MSFTEEEIKEIVFRRNMNELKEDLQRYKDRLETIGNELKELTILYDRTEKRLEEILKIGKFSQFGVM